MTKQNSGYAFHVHHNILVEYCTDYQGRVDQIKTYKPANEIELRLRLFKLIPLKYLPEARNEVWKACEEAWKAYEEAWEACEEVWKAYEEVRKAYEEARKAREEVWKAYEEAWKACEPELIALHNKLCLNCPWDGKTIFPEKVK